MLMDDAAHGTFARRRAAAAGLALILALVGVGGCAPYVGTTARSFLGHIRKNPDPNIRYVAYAKLGGRDVFDNDEQKAEAVATLVERYEKGNEPVAIRAIICRTLGELGDPKARDVLLTAVHHQEAVIKVEACRALGKVGLPEDATVLAQIMTLDHLEDARIAAIEGLADLKSDDPRIYRVLVDALEHEDPAIRFASLNTLRALTGKDVGTDAAAWRREMQPLMAKALHGAAAEADPNSAPTPEPPAGEAATAGADEEKGRSLFSRRP